jgi:Collagen triple helix repeat (20 copies)
VKLRTFVHILLLGLVFGCATYQLPSTGQSTGSTGPVGPQGPQGIPGPAGPPGPQGPQGFPGTNGTNGQAMFFRGSYATGTPYNFFDVVTFNGSAFLCVTTQRLCLGAPLSDPSWSEIASVGAQGPQGIQGIQGIQGFTGPQGAASTVPGPQGIQGLRGATGPQGPQGIPGTPGADSTVPGPQGPAGPQGTPGLPGLNSVPQAVEGSSLGCVTPPVCISPLTVQSGPQQLALVTLTADAQVTGVVSAMCRMSYSLNGTGDPNHFLDIDFGPSTATESASRSVTFLISTPSGALTFNTQYAGCSWIDVQLIVAPY